MRVHAGPRVGPVLPAASAACVSLCLPIHYGYNNKERPLRQLLSMPPTPLSSVGTCNSPLPPSLPHVTCAHVYYIMRDVDPIPLEQRPSGVFIRVESLDGEKKCFRRREYGHLANLWRIKMLAYSIRSFSSRKNIYCSRDSCNATFNRSVYILVQYFNLTLVIIIKKYVASLNT